MASLNNDQLAWLSGVRAKLVTGPRSSSQQRPERAAESNATPSEKKRELLKKGSRGEVVSMLQSRLNAALGASLAIDHIFGPKTQSAVRQFQRGRGLRADGVVGPRTWSAIHAG